MLLEFKAKPRVWKFILETMPTYDQLLGTSAPSKESPSRQMNTPMKSSPKDEVVDAPGLESIFKDLGAHAGKTQSLQSGGWTSIDDTSDAQVESKTPGTLIKPKKLYAWDRAPEPTGPDEYNVTGAAGSIDESVGGLSTISDAAVLTQAVKKIIEMATTIRSLARESRVRDQEQQGGRKRWDKLLLLSRGK